jgi:hypothetical protein
MVTLTASDSESGVRSTEYNLNGAGWTTYSAPFEVSSESTSSTVHNTVQYRSTDEAGNVAETESLTIRIDTTAPTVGASVPLSGSAVQGEIKFGVSLADALSGPAGAVLSIREADGASGKEIGYENLAAVYNSTSGNWELAQPFDTTQLPDGFYVLVATGKDVAGNEKTEIIPFSVRIGEGTPPVVTAQPEDQAVFAGDTVSFSAAADGDPAPSLTWQVSTDSGGTWSDVAGATASPLTFTASFDQNGNQYRAVFTNSAGIATSNAATLTVSQRDATCTITGWTGAYDGSPHGASGTCTDVNGEVLSGLDLGATFINVPGGTAHWTFTDITGIYGDQSGDVAIVINEAGNTAPVANPGGPYLGAINTSIRFNGSLSSDPDGEALTYAWTFGDGGTATGARPRHRYVASGLYDVCLTVSDGALTSSAACTQAVVYDPSAVVTGGRWINSPAGAYKPNESLSGRATFSFFLRYRRRASAPTGSVDFQFRPGGLNFGSTACEWLVVPNAGTNAQVKGSGLINRKAAPNGQAYKFMLWAGDGSPDTFRIKIWWEAGGVENVVYDNGVAQAIGGGQIIVYTRE